MDVAINDASFGLISRLSELTMNIICLAMGL
jgi:hypothetical protein